MTVKFEQYKTMESLIQTINARPLNDVFQMKGDTSKQSSRTGERKFTLTDTYEETLELITKGYKDPLEQLKKGIAKSQALSTYQRKRPVNSLVGYKANVPNYIAGHPLSMINRISSAEKTKTIYLTYGFTAVGAVEPADLVKAGILFLSLVNQLELEGYRVKIDVLFCSVEGKDTIGYSVNIKEYGQPMNLLKIAYPLVHPSMLRRTSFQWLETLTGLKNKGYLIGYGQPLVTKMQMDGKKEQAYLREHGLIKKDTIYCNTYQCFRDCQTVDELKKAIGL